METQNISVQLFNKELPISEKATYFGCKNDFTTDYLTTCVDYLKSDANIEDAFQKQLDLSDYYKSNQIFNTMKQQFADQTMEGMYNTSQERFPMEQLADSNTVEKPILPVGPRDTLFSSILGSKEGFGISNTNFGIIMLVVCCVFLFIAFMIRRMFGKMEKPKVSE
jgi:hypothetical protein